MLGKVLKYELRALGRFLLPFFGFSVAGALLLRLLMWTAPMIWAPAAEIIVALSSTTSVLLILALFLVTIIIILVRFYQSMVTNEGYLSFTLPVAVHTHLLGRLLSGVIFGVAGGFVTYFAGRIVSWYPDQPFFLIPPAQISQHGVSYPIPPALYLSLFTLVVFVLIASVGVALLKVYAAIAIGSQFNKHRKLGSVIAYWALGMVEGFVAMPAMMLLMVKLFGNDFSYFSSRFSSVASDPIALLQTTNQILWTVLGLGILLYLVLGTIYFFISNYIFTKKLNLE